MEKQPKRRNDKYWIGTNKFDHIQYELDLEDYISELQGLSAEHTLPASCLQIDVEKFKKLKAVAQAVVQNNGYSIIALKEMALKALFFCATKPLPTSVTAPEILKKHLDKNGVMIDKMYVKYLYDAMEEYNQLQNMCLQKECGEQELEIDNLKEEIRSLKEVNKTAYESVRLADKKLSMFDKLYDEAILKIIDLEKRFSAVKQSLEEAASILDGINVSADSPVFSAWKVLNDTLGQLK